MGFGWRSTILILVFGLAASLPAQTTESNTNHIKPPYCNFEEKYIFCDFKGSNLETLYLEPLNRTYDRIYIHNLPKLQISESVCTNLSLNNIGDIVFLDNEGDSCMQGFELVAVNSSLERLPYRVNDIYFDKCNVSSLVTHSTLKRMSVINTYVKVVNISNELNEESSVVFKRSIIGTLQKLNLDRVTLMMEDTNISFISPKGLIARHVVNIKNSFFDNTRNDSILLYPNVTLMLENYSGKFRISDIKEENLENSYFLAFVICLLIAVILLACLIILSIWVFKNKNNSRQLPESDEHKAIKNLNGVNETKNSTTEYTNEEDKKLLQEKSLTCPVKSDLYRDDVGEEQQKNTTQTSVNVTSETRQQSQSNTIVNKDRNTSYKTEVYSRVNESKGNEMSSKIKEDAVTSGKRKYISNENEFSKEGKNRKEKASHPDSSDRHNLKKTNDSPITSVSGSIKRTVEDAKAGDDEDKDIDQTLSSANPPPPNDMLPEPDDMITDNVILFRFYTLNPKEKSDILYAIGKDMVKVGLKKNTYTWSEVFNEMLSRNPSLSSLQVIKLKDSDFKSIQNGDHLSNMKETIIKTIKESNKTGASSLPPGQEGTKVCGDEVRTNPGKEHITQEVGNISTSENIEPFEKNKNGSNGSNLVRGVAKGSNSLSENNSKRNRGIEEDMISGPNQNTSMFNGDQQDNTSLKNENDALYVAEARDVNEDITKTYTTNMSLDHNETGSGDRQDNLNQENLLQGSPEFNPSPKTDMVTEPEDTITDN